QAASMACRLAGCSSAAMSMTGTVSVICLSLHSGRLPRLQPVRQQRVGIDFGAFVEGNAALLHEVLRASLAYRVEQVRAAADVLAADEDLRNGRHTEPRRQHRTDLPAQVVLLVFDGIEVHALVAGVELREQLSDGPAELAPFQREQDDRL